MVSALTAGLANRLIMRDRQEWWRLFRSIWVDLLEMCWKEGE